MYDHLPPIIKEWRRVEKTFCNLKFSNRSQIIGVPEGSKHFRQYTITSLFLDEAAFIDEVSETLAAVKPALGEIGKFTAVSSASPGAFCNLVFDNPY